MCAISILPSPTAIAFHAVSLLLNVDRKAVCLPLTAIEARLNEARQSKAEQSKVKQCKAKQSKQMKATCASLPFSLHVLVSMYSLLCMIVR